MSNKVNKKDDFIIIFNSNDRTRLLEYDSIISAIMHAQNEKVKKNEKIRITFYEILVQKLLNNLRLDSDSIRLTFNEFDILKTSSDYIKDKKSRSYWKSIIGNSVRITADFRSMQLISN